MKIKNRSIWRVSGRDPSGRQKNEVAIAIFVSAGLALWSANAKSAVLPVGDGQGVAVTETVEVTGHWNLLDLPNPVLPVSEIPRSSGGFGSGEAGGGVAGTGSSASDPGKTQRDKPPPANNNRTDDCTNPVSRNPVVLATGEKLKNEADFSSFGVYWRLRPNDNERLEQIVKKAQAIRWLDSPENTGTLSWSTWNSDVRRLLLGT